MKNYPLVTVYIPTYNRLNLLRRAVDSVRSQDYENLELIIVDDGSTDGTVEYLEDLAETEPRVRYFVNPTNSGACVSRNKAIFAARGDFITGLDDDDYFLPERISAFLSAWRSRGPKTIALFSNSRFCKVGNRTSVSRRIETVTRMRLFEMNHIGNQVFLPSGLIRSIGGFDESLPVWQDYDCWFRLFLRDTDVIQLVKDPTYVTDISHDKMRIGMTARDKKTKAFNVITRKIHASGRKLDSMKIELCDSMKLAPSVGLVVSKIIFSGKPINIGRAIKILVRSIVYRWPSYEKYSD